MTVGLFTVLGTNRGATDQVLIMQFHPVGILLLMYSLFLRICHSMCSNSLQVLEDQHMLPGTACKADVGLGWRGGGG